MTDPTAQTPPTLEVPTSSSTANNFLLKSRGVLSIDAIPKFKIYCTRFNLPSIGTKSVEIKNPFAANKFVGDHLDFQPLIVDFLVREDLTNWTTLQEWLYGITRPKDFQQWKDRELTYSDGTLFVLDANYQPTAQFRFINLCIEQLAGLDFDVQANLQQMKSVASFSLDYYEKQLLGPEAIKEFCEMCSDC